MVRWNRDTIRTVIPDREQATMALALMSMAMAQVAWEMASTVLWMGNSVCQKRLW